MEGLRPPGTYQEWVRLLERMAEGRNAGEALSALGAGTLQCGEQMLRNMEERVTRTADAMLRRTTKWYTRRINEALEDGDYSCLTLQFYRLRREIPGLRFYRAMGFLPKSFVEELDRQVLSELERYRLHLISGLRDAAEETHNDLLEEELLRIRRIRFDQDAQ